MRQLHFTLLVLALSVSSAAFANGTKAGNAPKPNAAVDCSADYGQPSTCEKIACGEIYSEFVGTWSGQFYAYEREKSKGGKPVYRPYRNTISYSQDECLKNSTTGDSFIVGHQTDEYPAFEDLPAKTTTGLLITGKKADGTSFLRTVGKDGARDFQLVYRNSAAKLVVWKLDMPSAGGNPQMSITTIDGRDYTAAPGDARAVTVTMTVGPPDAPYWEGVVAHGTHSKN
jgi:hypothetical protein